MANKKDATLDDVLIQLQMLNRLIAAPLKEGIGQKQVVKLLAGSGASAAEIAHVLDTTPATVSTTLQRLKRKKRSTEPAPATEEPAA